tara:strand:- start:318 stop:548 length:231 start_codon:yes stop_codon:yes gene_type:complete
MKKGARVLGRGWTRSGTIDEPRAKIEIEAEGLTRNEKIIRDLKSEPFERGVTFKKLSEKYGLSTARIQRIKSENNL